MRLVATITSAGLAVLAGLHVAWGSGSAFPASDREALADLVAGTEQVPGRSECYAVGGLLAVASSLVVDAAPLPTPLRRAGVVVAATVLAVRGVAGVSGRTSMLVPWEPSAGFVARDRRFYGPLCLALAAGTASSRRA